MDDTLVEMQAVVQGLVQGVGFRWTVRQYADQLKIKGNVRNLDNGNVEIFAQGPKNRLELLLNQLRENCGMGRIDSIETKFYSPKAHFDRFTILS